MDIKKTNNAEGKPEIKLNRKMRMWHKYRNYCFMAAGVLAVLIICIAAIKGFSKNSDTPQKSTDLPTKDIAQETGTDAPTEPTEPAGTDAPTEQAEPTASQPSGNTYTVAGKAERVDFTSKDAFDGAVFLGDSIVSGISYYGYLDDAQVISNVNMTTDKAINYVSSIKAADPEKVFIMVGLNDANYGTRDADSIVGYLEELTAEVHAECPSAKVYLLSLLPVTQAFENRSNVNVKQSLLDEVNAKLSEQADSIGAYYIDVASAYKDGTGYMNSDCTGNGSNLSNPYYPFLLNGIAGVLK